MTTVNIEEVDESWAIKLLDECEIEDEPIIVQAQEFGITRNKNDITQINTSDYPEFDSLIQELIDSNNKGEIEKFDGFSKPLSAIENQKLALIEMQEDQVLPEQRGKLRSHLNLARLKDFFRPKSLDMT